MIRKEKVDLIIAICLVLLGCTLLVFPSLKIINVRNILLGVFVFYGVVNALQFILTSKDHDYEGLFTAIASIISLILLGILGVDKPMNLALIIFIWIILMSLIKLKKCDYYHDRHRRIFILKIITLVLFIITGLLCVLNLYYQKEVQILVLGFFFFIHGILELVDPVTNYISRTDT